MRLVKGLTNEEIAEFMGVQRPTVSTWLHGRRTPPKTTVMLWADMCGVDREWLLTGTPSNEWYAIRDSNPEPADFGRLCAALELVPFHVKPGLTLDRRAS